MSAEIAAIGLPEPVSTPMIWPETGGRGFLVSEPGRRPLGNAETLRFMAPRIYAGDQTRYLRYTDPSGDYVEPSTGGTRGTAPPVQQDTSDEIAPEPSVRTPKHPWSWPADAINAVDVNELEGVVLGRRVADIKVDPSGARLVLERGSGTEPAVYLDLVEPRLSLSSSGEPVVEVERDHIVGAEAIAHVGRTGDLAIVLATGLTLKCAAEQDFEAWQLVSQDVGLWISLPGGELAEFSFSDN
jgi:Family of unknown function (DUF6188)